MNAKETHTRRTRRPPGFTPCAADAPTMDEDRPGRARLLALLLAGVIGPGLARWALGQLGYDRVGVAVFVAGYALAIGLAWQYWLRGVEFAGPDG